MPAYSFKEQFIPLIKSGVKCQTIRKRRKRQAKPGDTVYLYFGMRTKWCTKIGEGLCTKTSAIRIASDGVFINDKKLNASEKEKLAVADGFENFNSMDSWWKEAYGLSSFNGDIIYWELKTKPEENDYADDEDEPEVFGYECFGCGHIQNNPVCCDKCTGYTMNPLYF